MTLLQYLFSTVYRHYIKRYILGVIAPIQTQSAIFIDADFRNPQTLTDSDFRNPQTLSNSDFRNPQTLTNVDFVTVTEIV